MIITFIVLEEIHYYNVEYLQHRFEDSFVRYNLHSYPCMLRNKNKLCRSSFQFSFVDLLKFAWIFICSQF